MTDRLLQRLPPLLQRGPLLVACVAALSTGSPVVGQEPRTDSITTAPSRDAFSAGRAAGFEAATAAADVRGLRFAAGAASGFVFVPWGVLGLLLPWPQGLAPAAFSIGLYAFAQRAGSTALTPPPSTLEELQGQDRLYRAGFMEGWETSIRQRRKAVVVAGALTGAAAGAAFFFLVFATGT